MDVSTQQLLIRFAGTLNRRRAYSPAHPIVIAAEEQLLASISDALRERATLSIGVARNELIVDGELWDMRNGVARELANRLQRRGVGAIVLESGLSLDDLRDSLAWLVLEPGGANDVPPNAGGFHITRTAYDLLILDDAIRDAQSAIASLWRTLAEVTGIFAERHDQFERDAALAEEYAGLPLMFDDAPSGDHGFDTDAILEAISSSLDDPTVARRTAVALLELTNHGVTTTREGRDLIGEQVLTLLERLGRTSLGPIVKGLVEGAKQQQFVAAVMEVLPVAEAVTWLEAAAQAREQQISHQLVRLMSKLSTVAEDRGDIGTEDSFRDAAREIVTNWSLSDPNPAEHVALLDRIAGFERNTQDAETRRTDRDGSTIESTRLVQMALELDTVGDDTIAAVEALVGAGESREMMSWITVAGPIDAARQLRATIVSDRVVRQLLLTEPVDRLQARALLDELDVSSADTLLDILGEASSKGTRLLVRQRLAEFGDAITPRLVARLTDGPWYLIRNVLSLLAEMSASAEGSGSMDALTALQAHAQVQVRIEALRVLARMDDTSRTAAFSRALRDDNERVLVMALQELADSGAERGSVPDALVQQIMAMVDKGAPSEPVRARAIRTLLHVRSTPVRDWLIGIVTRRSAILRQLKLAEPTLPAVSALHVLTKVYADDPEVERVRAMAGKVANDPRWQVRDAGMSTGARHMKQEMTFLTALGQAFSAQALYSEDHPMQRTALTRLHAALRDVLRTGALRLSFLENEVVAGARPITEMRGWEWSGKLWAVGVQRLEVAAEPAPSVEDVTAMLSAIRQRLAGPAGPGSAWQHKGMRAGPLSVQVADKVDRDLTGAVDDGLRHAGLGAEVDAVRYLHSEVEAGRGVPLAEVDGIVRALAATIRREQGCLMPLLDIRSFDEYTTSHCCNVAMLSMGIADQLGLSDADTRAIGTAALLHDIGKTRLPLELLVKPGKLTAEERLQIQAHPVEGAKILTARGLGNSLAATVAYEHHIWFNGLGGYPTLSYPRMTHFASRIVHVSDIYDAVSSRRPYHDPWPRDKALDLIGKLSGVELDPVIATAFLTMTAGATEHRQQVSEQAA